MEKVVYKALGLHQRCVQTNITVCLCIIPRLLYLKSLVLIPVVKKEKKKKNNYIWKYFDALNRIIAMCVLCVQEQTLTTALFVVQYGLGIYP